MNEIYLMTDDRKIYIDLLEIPYRFYTIQELEYFLKTMVGKRLSEERAAYICYIYNNKGE
jgi:hypothetical protein